MKKNFILLISSIFILSACSTKTDVVTNVPSTNYKSEIEAYRAQEMANRKPSASLWSESGNQGNMFLDYKARHIGDIVIVNITEMSSASNSSSKDSSKTTAYNAGIDSILGLPTNMGATNFLGSGNPLSPTIAANTGNSFSGQGSATKSDRVSATIAARIIDILPSGNLVIEGNREILIDDEKQTITLKGIVRQKDIDATNTVASSAIADAQITYSGSGERTNATKKGWFAKFIDVIWPF